MKRILALCLSWIMALSLFTGCAADAKGTRKEKIENETKKLSVYTSFYPMYDFAKKVGGDRIELVNLVPAGTEPHDWEPATTDMVNLSKADVFIYNGAGMEQWADKVIASLENKKLRIVEASKDIALKNGADDEDGKDPHIWLSIRNAKKEMETIKNALVQADPANKDFYEDNYQSNAEKFDALDKEYKISLSPVKNKSIVVAHQAFGYLCHDYGLNQIAIEGLSADSEPDPARMSQIIKFAKDNQIKTIFFEELVSPKVAQTIASELGAKTDMLNPLEGLTEEALASGEDYLSVMRSNLKALIGALR